MGERGLDTSAESRFSGEELVVGATWGLPLGGGKNQFLGEVLSCFLQK